MTGHRDDGHLGNNWRFPRHLLWHELFPATRTRARGRIAACLTPDSKPKNDPELRHICRREALGGARRFGLWSDLRHKITCFLPVLDPTMRISQESKPALCASYRPDLTESCPIHRPKDHIRLSLCWITKPSKPQSLANRRQRLSQARVRSTIQRWESAEFYHVWDGGNDNPTLPTFLDMARVSSRPAQRRSGHSSRGPLRVWSC
jgi:hypothetical protein